MAALTDVATTGGAALQVLVGAIRYVFKVSMRTANAARSADTVHIAVAAVSMAALGTYAIHIVVDAALRHVTLVAVEGMFSVGAILLLHPVMLFAIEYATVFADGAVSTFAYAAVVIGIIAVTCIG